MCDLQERKGEDDPLVVTLQGSHGTSLLLVTAGQRLYARMKAEQEVVVLRNAGRYDSEDLCRLQEARSRLGIVGAKLIASNHGWYLRYDSGLQDFGIIACGRHGHLDGTYAHAAHYAKNWVAADPARRYAWVSESDLRDCDHQTGAFLSATRSAA